MRMLPKSEYGYITYAVSILAFLIPFMGAGIHQGLIRYGSLSEGQSRKKQLFQLTLVKGLQISGILVVVLLLLTPFITRNLPEAAFYLSVLSFQLVGLLLFQFVGIYCRLVHLNRLFAKMENINNVLLVIFNIGLCYLFQGPGYVFSLVTIPFVVGLFFMYHLNLLQFNKIKNIELPAFNKYIRYGMSVSIGGVLSQMLYAVDILLIGNLLKDSEMVAQYKAASILPFSLLFIPVAIITTDFIKLARAAKNDKPYLRNYYLNYLKLFTGISVIIFLLFYLFGDKLLSLFGKDYEGTPELLVVFAAGIVGGLLFRVPLGNMLSAIGWPHINALFSGIILILNLIGSYFMIQSHGLMGAAIVTSSLMWLSGLLSLGAFWWFLNKS